MRLRRRERLGGVKLDEGFVRAARFVEPSALERARSNDATGHPSRSRVLAVRPPKLVHLRWWLVDRGRWPGRRIGRLLALAALVAGVAGASLVLFRLNAVRTATPTRPGGTTPSPGAARTTGSALTAAAVPFALDSSVAARTRAGTCLTWTPTMLPTAATVTATATAVVAAAASSAGQPVAIRVVGWAGPHTAEVTGDEDLRGQFPTWPGPHVLGELAAFRCPSDLTSYLRGAPNPPAGRAPVASGVYPDESSWANGVEELVCTAVAAGPAPVTGSVRAAVR